MVPPVASLATPPTPADSQKTQTDPNQANDFHPKWSAAAPRRKSGPISTVAKLLAEAKTLTDFGPRPSGSDANKQVRQHLIDRLTNLGWQTTEQRLTEHAPDGRDIEFCNLMARFSRYPASPQRILIGAHFDTPPTQEFRDLGASDGGANTAILLELARTLALDPQLAGSVELLFLDGDAPFRELNLNDGLFGSRFYAQMLRINRHAGDIRAAILLDNVGGGSAELFAEQRPEPGCCVEESRDDFLALSSSRRTVRFSRITYRLRRRVSPVSRSSMRTPRF